MKVLFIYDMRGQTNRVQHMKQDERCLFTSSDWPGLSPWCKAPPTSVCSHGSRVTSMDPDRCTTFTTRASSRPANGSQVPHSFVARTQRRWPNASLMLRMRSDSMCGSLRASVVCACNRARATAARRPSSAASPLPKRSKLPSSPRGGASAPASHCPRQPLRSTRTACRPPASGRCQTKRCAIQATAARRTTCRARN